MERRCHHKASSHYLLVGGKIFVFNGFIYSIIHGVSLFSTETLQNLSICICSEKLITTVDSNKNGITALTFYSCEIRFCVVSTKFSSRIESVPSCQEIHLFPSSLSHWRCVSALLILPQWLENQPRIQQVKEANITVLCNRSCLKKHTQFIYLFIFWQLQQSFYFFIFFVQQYLHSSAEERHLYLWSVDNS